MAAGIERSNYQTPAPNLRPVVSHAGAEQKLPLEKLTERFGLEFKPFARSDETLYDQLIKRRPR
jgi:hypothetical protein